MGDTNKRPEDVVREERAQLDFSRDMSYGDYLQLDAVLNAQKPLSPAHDEMLFIVQHQTSELWMKLMLHELHAAIAHIARDELPPAFKMLARVSRIMEQLVHAWDVLATMTPPEYSALRPYLARSSGFQSHQYRALEFMLGNKDANLLLPHRATPEIHAFLDARLKQPSLYDEFLRYLARHGYAVPAERTERDWTRPYEKSEGVMRVFQTVYEEPGKHWLAYDMAEKLVDVEERFQLWRFRHMKTVHRIIGLKMGTGGSSGVPFLQRALGISFFPELWDVRTELKAPAP